jgi:hypothetical protein
VGVGTAAGFGAGEMTAARLVAQAQFDVTTEMQP